MIPIHPGSLVYHRFGSPLRVLRVHPDGIEAMAAVPSYDYATDISFYAWSTLQGYEAWGTERHGVTPDAPPVGRQIKG